jgi:hypothetical protein
MKPDEITEDALSRLTAWGALAASVLLVSACAIPFLS